jgi:hypothetical protein
MHSGELNPVNSMQGMHSSECTPVNALQGIHSSECTPVNALLNSTHNDLKEFHLRIPLHKIVLFDNILI